MSADDWMFAYVIVGAMVGTVVHVSKLERDEADDYELGAVLAMLLWPIVVSVAIADLVARLVWRGKGQP